jgi:hypothetical protein
MFSTLAGRRWVINYTVFKLIMGNKKSYKIDLAITLLAFD